MVVFTKITKLEISPWSGDVLNGEVLLLHLNFCLLQTAQIYNKIINYAVILGKHWELLALSFWYIILVIMNIGLFF